MKNFKEKVNFGTIIYNLIFAILQILLYSVIMKIGEFIVATVYHKLRSRKK